LTTRERHRVKGGACYVYEQVLTERYVGVCTEPGHPHAKTKERPPKSD
jgi:hypothetical protein